MVLRIVELAESRENEWQCQCNEGAFVKHSCTAGGAYLCIGINLASAMTACLHVLVEPVPAARAVVLVDGFLHALGTCHDACLFATIRTVLLTGQFTPAMLTSYCTILMSVFTLQGVSAFPAELGFIILFGSAFKTCPWIIHSFCCVIFTWKKCTAVPAVFCYCILSCPAFGACLFIHYYQSSSPFSFPQRPHFFTLLAS